VAADQSGRGRRHARRLATVLAPLGQPQERVLSTFTFWAVHGIAWIDALVEEWDPLGAEHLVAYLGDER